MCVYNYKIRKEYEKKKNCVKKREKKDDARGDAGWPKTLKGLTERPPTVQCSEVD